MTGPSRILAALAALLATFAVPAAAQDETRWSFAIHGGAGTMSRADMTPERRAAYEAALQRALDAGAAVLRDGGTAMDAVEAAIVLMEDDEKFNAGRGAVFTWEGRNELDAAVMDGRDRSAGAVTGVTSIRHPIRLARAVMADGRHVFLSGAGAEEFARDHELETAGPEWFATDARREALQRMKAEKVSALDVDLKFGTVGAVALDRAGNLAAGTSTGGMTGKRWGRIGDAPVIGAGTYADNRSCAVSATGWGEYFIRVGVAQEICTRLRLAGRTTLPELEDGAEAQASDTIQLTEPIVQNVSDAVLAEVAELGGDGGVIVLARSGAAVFSFNTSGMYRGRATSEGVNEVAIFADE
ncbi:isoaspartyl peptidase/L-asparaginase family protein [Qipengyuania spongiae]|uniref:Isoaspartyl peptidase/L-asparaginase n=1 Tax=Qipengyuania spongiae TaxID=2909673 RepID=A0ABY5T263_9SPHN|nr:isoaspartyl peptidase/L-asparaginase [Qipengyuania spongiae]UVI39351.1 isoaspartyl peptidase/L-asparaginase [Qipengyuania spongiae]